MNTKLNYNLTLSVDVVVFTIEDGQLKVLLIKRAHEPYRNSWALPGAFVRDGELILGATSRVLKEKVGATKIYLEQLYTFDGSGRDPRGHIPTVSYMAMLDRAHIKIKETVSTQNPTFYSLNKLPALAFDHKAIVTYALKRIRAKLEYTNLAFSLLPKHFTLTQLQRVYEIIMNKKFDKRNFRKKIVALKLIRETDKIMTGAHQRPARLYQFTAQQPFEIDKFIDHAKN